MALARRNIKRALLVIPTAFALSAGALVAACQTAKPEPATTERHVDEGELRTAQTAAASAALTLDNVAPAMNANGATALSVRPTDFAVEATLEEFRVGLDDLAKSKEQARLLDTGRKVYVMSGQNHRSAVFMRKGTSGWAVSQIHGKDLGDSLGDALTMLRANVHADNDEFFLVDVSGLHLMLIGHRQKGALFLTPPSDRQDLSLTANTVMPASELLPRLAVDARQWMTESAKMFGGH
jgi:hypothetical protein